MHREGDSATEHKSGRIERLKEMLRPRAPKNIARPLVLCAAIALQLFSLTSCSYDSITYRGSANWSGYITEQKGRDIVQVQGNFIVPAVTRGCDVSISPPKNASTLPKTAIWVGIGGVDEKSLVQIGVIATYGKIVFSKITAHNTGMLHELIRPVATYYGFYETLPFDSVVISKLAIYPGDTMRAGVYKVPGTIDSFVVTLQDLSRKEKPFSLTVKPPIGNGYEIPHLSAEWIVEKVSTGISANAPLYPMAGFKKVQFSNSGFETSSSFPSSLIFARNNVANGAVTNVQIYGMDEFNRNYNLAEPSSLLHSGSGFDVMDSKCALVAQ